MRRFAACFSTAQGQRGLPTSCVPPFCDPARPHEHDALVDGPDSDDGASTPRADDDLDGELLSPLEASRGWPREPET